MSRAPLPVQIVLGCSCSVNTWMDGGAELWTVFPVSVHLASVVLSVFPCAYVARATSHRAKWKLSFSLFIIFNDFSNISRFSVMLR